MRAEYAKGHLDPKQVARLEELGLVWSVHDQAWEDGLAIACEYARRHGTLAAPIDAVVDGYPIGKWLENRRAQGRRGGLAAGRREALDALAEGEEWRLAHWPVARQRHATHAADYLAEYLAEYGERNETGERDATGEKGEGPRLDDVALGVVHRGTPIGRWVARQRSGW
ncbi:helicase associated domain-containing protein, partial [Streptomyces sp. SID3343]|uniref:helicase associated domain-containing protein n=1 Tax=Streptomyces sp. SID3343 TaxID=2690260 RepID=UPI0013C213D6